MLQTLDQHWREHLAALDHLRQGIHLRGYAQKNPKQEYKREAFELFSDMLDRIKHDVVKIVLTVQVRSRAGRAGGRGGGRRCPTCATSTPTTTRRSRPTPDDPPPAARRRRSCAPARRSAATIRVRADRARNTSTATAGSEPSHDSHISRAIDPGQAPCPSITRRRRRNRLLPVAGRRRSAPRPRPSRTGRATISSWSSLCAGARVGGRVHAESLLRGAGARSAASISPLGGETRALVDQRRQRQCRHRRARACRCAAHLRERGAAARLRR